MTNSEKAKATMDYLSEYGEFAKIINKDHEDASKIFAGAINYAVTIFVNRLFLGGAWQDTENFEEIRSHLSELINLLKK